MDSILLADNIAIAEYRATYLPQTQFDPISGALGSGGSHQPHRADRDRLDDLRQAVGARPQVRDAGSSQRRSRRLEHRHHRHTACPANSGEPDHPDHADRYARAHEFVEVVTRVWDSWEGDAVIGHRERGVWADRSKLHAPRFHGRYYDVEGVQPFPRSPQGHPVLVLAGQSGAGVELAARYAEMAFSGPPSLEAAVALRTDLHA
jgi:hypothetical protein